MMKKKKERNKKMNYVKIGDIVEDNGRTIRENNLEIEHNIPVGTLVNVEYEDNFEGGAYRKIKAHLWIVYQGRDCDGTPLYWVSKHNPNKEQLKFSNLIFQQ